MVNNAKKDDYELDVASGDQPQPFDNPYNDSTVSVLGPDPKRKNSATRSDDLDDNGEDRRPLYGARVAMASTSSAGNSVMSLGINQDGEEYDGDQRKRDGSHQEYQLYKRRWVGVVALVSKSAHSHLLPPYHNFNRYSSTLSRGATGSGLDRSQTPLRTSFNLLYDKSICLAMSPMSVISSSVGVSLSWYGDGD
jgi:hypothetical protein